MQTKHQVDCEVDCSHSHSAHKDPVADEALAEEERQQQEDGVDHCQWEHLTRVAGQHNSLDCCAYQVATDSTNRLQEETAQPSLGANQEDLGVFFLAIPEAERVDCETVEHKREDDSYACDEVELVCEREVTGQSQLGEAVEGQPHNVGLRDHHKQTPPHQRGFEVEVDFPEGLAVLVQNVQHKQQYPQEEEEQGVEEKVRLVSFLRRVEEVDSCGILLVVGSQQLPVLEVHASLYGVLIDVLEKWE